MSTQWKDRAIALERQLKELDNEARTRIDLAIERNMELERQVQDAQYTIIMLQRRLNEGSVDINPPPVPPVAEFDNVADAQAYIAQRQEEGGPGLDLEVELVAEGFHLEGVDSEGNVLDPEALRLSILAIEETFPEHYAELVEKHADVMSPPLEPVE